MKKKIEIEIVQLTHSTMQNHNYAVILGEKHGERRLPIIIGGFEAQAIAVALERMSPNRPLTHDLLRNIFIDLDVTLEEVVINDYQEGIFYAQLVCSQRGDHYEIDARSSDALALAVRVGCPIYTYAEVLEQAGIVIEESLDGSLEARPVAESRPKTLASHTVQELEQLLDEALSHEDYERAAAIRDEVKRRSE